MTEKDVLTEKPKSKCRAVAKYALFILVVATVGYYYFLELSANIQELARVEYVLNGFYLVLAMVFGLLSYCVDAAIWKKIIGRQETERHIKLKKIIAILYTTALLRYLPWVGWTYVAQISWFAKHGIAKTAIITANLVIIAQFAMVSVYLLLGYLAVYSDVVPSYALVLLVVTAVMFNVALISFSQRLFGKLTSLVKRFTGVPVRPVVFPPGLMLSIQGVSTLGWLLAVFAVYFLAKGVGLPVVVADLLPIAAALVTSWLAGYLAVFAPGGLGVREGVMLVMLQPAVAAQTALLLPLLARIMFMIAEAVLGFMATVLIGDDKRDDKDDSIVVA